MSRIEARFADLKQAGEGALVVFMVAGHPTPEACAASLLAVAEAGADVIEVGIPFSDPLADGPVIQAASQRALQQGVTPQPGAFIGGGVSEPEGHPGGGDDVLQPDLSVRRGGLRVRRAPRPA